jgi:hypothetical protein
MYGKYIPEDHPTQLLSKRHLVLSLDSIHAPVSMAIQYEL